MEFLFPFDQSVRGGANERCRRYLDSKEPGPGRPTTQSCIGLAYSSGLTTVANFEGVTVDDFIIFTFNTNLADVLGSIPRADIQ